MSFNNYSINGAEGKQIAVDFVCAEPDSKHLVVFSHGFKGFKDWGTHHLVARYFAAQGLNFLKFNFSHNGMLDTADDSFDDLEGFANNTLTRELFDLNQVVSFALSGEKFIKPSQLCLIGHSLGGAISIIEAAENHAVNKLVTWSSICNFRTLWSSEQEEQWLKAGVLHFENSRTKQQMPIYSGLLKDLSENAERLNVLSAAKKVVQPWLIIHGGEDPVVPTEQAQKLHNQQPNAELMIIPSGDHVFCAKHPWTSEQLPDPLKQACDATIAFFKA